jgi:D-alanine-D-alanine ligase
VPGLHIALVYDGKEDYLAAGFSPLDVMEFDDEGVISGIEGGLGVHGHTVVRVGRGLELARRLAAGERWDLVFNIAEGLRGRGREAQVPALCEMFDQPYTFSDSVTCGVTLDKAWAKRVVRDAGLPTAPFAVVRTPEDAAGVDLEPPLFVKPLAEGSSKGVTGRSLVGRREELEPRCRELLEDFHDGLLVESFLPGREVTVGVVGSGRDARPVGVLEVSYTRRAETRAYTALNKDQYVANCRYRLLRRGALARRASEVAVGVYRALECRDAGRVDLRCDASGEPHFLEVNPLPGLHPVRSDLPILARLGGLEYEELLAEIVDSAATRYRLNGRAVSR